MLSEFLKNLLETGILKVGRKVEDFTENDKINAFETLTKVFESYRIKFPNHQELKFDSQSGMWALTYLYRMCQTFLLRELTEEEVIAALPIPGFKKSRSTIISVDFIFQFVPELFEIFKELAPSDVLTKEIKKISEEWSFSLFELADTINVSGIEKDELLLKIYCSRLIEKEHIKGVVSKTIENEIALQLGGYQNHYWKTFKKTTYAK